MKHFYIATATCVAALLLSVLAGNGCSGPRAAIGPGASAAGDDDRGASAADAGCYISDPGRASSDGSVAGKSRDAAVLATDAITTTGSGKEEVASEEDGRRPEVRAVWVTRWDYRSAQDVEQILETIATTGFNRVYFQVRGAADAYYRSTIEPWAASLSGKLGKDPGWDPLAVAVDKAHELGIQLHAWLNICTAWKGRKPPGRSTPRHILRVHPEWRVAEERGRTMRYGPGYVFVNPAIDGFARHMRSVVAEIASFYSVDGLHFDYARYPSARASYDKIGMRLYKKARKKEKSLTRAEWQRERLTLLIGSLKEEARKVKPDIVVSAAVTGIYKDRWGWGEVTQGFVDFHQDSHRWARAGVVDELVPMIYWKPTRPPKGRTDFLTLAEDFECLANHVELIAGINVAAGGFDVLKNEVEIVRSRGYSGIAIFSWALLKERGWLNKLAKTIFVTRPKIAGR